MAKPKAKSTAKPKKVPYRLIEKKDSQFGGMYRIMNDIVHEHHSHLRDARIALAWHKGWKADVDGRVKLGMCKKVSDLDRQLQDFDFIIILNREFWTTPTVTEAQKKALIDHELCHAQVVHDDNDDPAENELGQVIYRMRGHDVEEFGEIVERHGIWKRDLERFFQAARRGPKLDFEGKQSEVTKAEAEPILRTTDNADVH